MLSLDESLNLLLSRLKVVLHEDLKTAEYIVRELGFLPLAIDSASAYITANYKTLKEYKNLLDTAAQEILSHRPELASHPMSVLRSLEINFGLLDKNTDALELFLILASLRRAEVNEEFLKRSVTSQLRWGESGNMALFEPSSLDIPDDIYALFSNPVNLDAAVEVLTSLSLILIASKADTGRAFALHPLVHKCANLWIGEEKRVERKSVALCLLTQAYPSDVSGTADKYDILSVKETRKYLTTLLASSGLVEVICPMSTTSMVAPSRC
jgi:hypothetical protein